MADEADRGNDAAELFLKIARDNVPAAVPAEGIGICINCGVDVEGDRRWCGVECRDDYLWATNRGR
jgi:hypothetical protein